MCVLLLWWEFVGGSHSEVFPFGHCNLKPAHHVGKWCGQFPTFLCIQFTSRALKGQFFISSFSRHFWPILACFSVEMTQKWHYKRTLILVRHFKSNFTWIAAPVSSRFYWTKINNLRQISSFLVLCRFILVFLNQTRTLLKLCQVLKKIFFC